MHYDRVYDNDRTSDSNDKSNSDRHDKDRTSSSNEVSNKDEHNYNGEDSNEIEKKIKAFKGVIERVDNDDDDNDDDNNDVPEKGRGALIRDENDDDSDSSNIKEGCYPKELSQPEDDDKSAKVPYQRDNDNDNDNGDQDESGVTNDDDNSNPSAGSGEPARVVTTENNLTNTDEPEEENEEEEGFVEQAKNFFDSLFGNDTETVNPNTDSVPISAAGNLTTTMPGTIPPLSTPTWLQNVPKVGTVVAMSKLAAVSSAVVAATPKSLADPEQSQLYNEQTGEVYNPENLEQSSTNTTETQGSVEDVENSEVDSTNEAPKNVDDILEDSEPGRRTKGKTEQFVKDGGLEKANEDFDNLKPSNVKNFNTKKGPGRTGSLPDGRKATVRPKSSDGRSTLEIRNPGNKRGIEIRYNN